MVQWLRLYFQCRGYGFNPWSGTKILHASQRSQNFLKNNLSHSHRLYSIGVVPKDHLTEPLALHMRIPAPRNSKGQTKQLGLGPRLPGSQLSALSTPSDVSALGYSKAGLDTVNSAVSIKPIFPFSSLSCECVLSHVLSFLHNIALYTHFQEKSISSCYSAMDGLDNYILLDTQNQQAPGSICTKLLSLVSDIWGSRTGYCGVRRGFSLSTLCLFAHWVFFLIMIS